ncbi:hypothetical protein DL98DRAFT_538041 [Cadophora sp. DSE1049]|nr:hypothetical protein DL98DRAFT_538041 [Cadophora sp. DSE1049]
MSSPTPAHPISWRANQGSLEDEDPESSPEVKSPLSPGPYPELITRIYSNAAMDRNLAIRLEATGLEREELSGDSPPGVPGSDVLDPDLVGDGRAGIPSPGLLGKEVLDPRLFEGSSTGMMQVSGGTEQQSGSLENVAGQPNPPPPGAPAPSMGQMQSRMLPPLGASLIQSATSSRITGPHNSAQAAHCCGFLLDPIPQGLSNFRLQLLHWSSYFSQWTRFREITIDGLPTPISAGSWIYELRQTTISQNGTAMQQRHLGFFFGGDYTCPIPYRLATREVSLEARLGFLRVGFQPLYIQCSLPGHCQMTVLAWMSHTEFNVLESGLRSETLIQRGQIGV